MNSIVMDHLRRALLVFRDFHTNKDTHYTPESCAGIVRAYCTAAECNIRPFDSQQDLAMKLIAILHRVLHMPRQEAFQLIREFFEDAKKCMRETRQCSASLENFYAHILREHGEQADPSEGMERLSAKMDCMFTSRDEFKAQYKLLRVVEECDETASPEYHDLLQGLTTEALLESERRFGSVIDYAKQC
jgi:hypothetical protein